VVGPRHASGTRQLPSKPCRPLDYYFTTSAGAKTCWPGNLCPGSPDSPVSYPKRKTISLRPSNCFRPARNPRQPRPLPGRRVAIRWQPRSHSLRRTCSPHISPRRSPTFPPYSRIQTSRANRRVLARPITIIITTAAALPNPPAIRTPFRPCLANWATPCNPAISPPPSRPNPACSRICNCSEAPAPVLLPTPHPPRPAPTSASPPDCRSRCHGRGGFRPPLFCASPAGPHTPIYPERLFVRGARVGTLFCDVHPFCGRGTPACATAVPSSSLLLRFSHPQM
jgi:hypothetical protein